MSNSPVIKASDRVLVVGFTGSGKSEWIYAHAKHIRGQLLVMDVKADMRLKIPHVNAYSPQEVKTALKKNRVVRFVPNDPFNQDVWNDIFKIVFDTPNLRWWLDEAIGVTTPNGAPKNLIRVLTQGRSRGLGGFAAAQRPVGFTPYLRNQADHLVIFAQRWSTRDLQDLSIELGFDSPKDMRRVLDDLRAQFGDLGRYAHLHFERATGKLWARPPIPDHLRK